MARSEDLTGRTFGKLTVLALAPGRVPGRHKRYTCHCACGRISVVYATSLRSGKTVSCGCVRRTTGQTHGQRYSLTYSSWVAMRNRCTNRLHSAYPQYGGRGIQVCERWHKFSNFLQDMGHRPHKRMTLDRIDPDGHYCPENCRWADYATQATNKRKHKNPR